MRGETHDELMYERPMCVMSDSAPLRQSSAGAGDPLSDAELHPRLVRSPPPSRNRRRTAPAFFQIHEKANIVVSVRFFVSQA